MTKLGESLLQGIAEARGETALARTITCEGPEDYALIRKRLGLSQDKFAKRFHLPPASVRDWEQGRRVPDAAARSLLRIIDYAPETVERALAAV